MTDSNLNNHKLYKQLLTAPKDALDYLNLIYVTDAHLDIKRIKKDNGFNYKKRNNKPLTNGEIKRINKLVLPPAWESVKITSLKNGHLQAVGRDKRLRKQYRYHDKWSKIRNQTKFYKMYAFGKALPKIRERVEADLQQKRFTKTKVLALVIKLLEETHIRIGNSQYAKRNKTYGLSTLRSKHVDIFKNKAKFEFTGKRGKKHSITIRNKRLIKLVNQCEEISGWKLFKYYDSAGDKHNVDSSMVNAYLQNISSEYFTAKDFRTWSASLIFFETLQDFETTSDDKLIQKNILKAFDAASKALGNTRNVVRKYYVHPILPSFYQNGSIKKYFDISKSAKSKSMHQLSSSEYAMLSLIKNFKFDV